MTLVGWWPLHDDSATDYSGNENHGTLNGGPTTGVAGRGGLQAMSFDGTDDYIEVSHDAAIDPDYITVSMWIRVPDGESNTRPLIKGPSGTSIVYNFYINSDASPKPRFEVSVGGSFYSATGDVTISDGSWHHIVGTYDGDSVNIYIDGSLSSRNNSPSGTMDDSTNNLLLGAGDTSGSRATVGSIGDVRVYSRVLSDAEIRTLYQMGNADLASPPKDGISRYPLDGDATDAWGSNGGTVNGSVFASDAVRGQSADFAGGGEYIDTPISNLPATTSVSVWAKPRSISNGGQEIVSTRGSQAGLGVRTRDNDTFKPYIYDSDAGTYRNVQAPATTGDWYHLVFVVEDGNKMQLYVNGQLEDTQSIGKRSLGNNVQIGGDTTKNNHYDGLADEVRIYDYALSPSEVHELYQWGTRGKDMRKHLVNRRQK